ncbi:hypothetical protein AN401_14190 [Zobellella denitrificans]|uniref:Uncharacterized protein n=1 Tax=Zobellella denitrificans TaxID=347534 RepID=A0A291HRW6_9GAMM|nr:hypothetical protein [Zobellella denitrificans]ATG74864.1 hypothetical protein AN401_14190 [Zobellella denitrificans]
MYLDKFLTEYDDSLSSELNIDPLGVLVIWSAFGQAIFKGRVNSISNDVRNYTLNLFHHYVLKSLVEDDAVLLGSALHKRYSSKADLNFRYACLIHLENLFVYSMLAHESSAGADTVGVLGISKARRRWNESHHNPLISFGHEGDCQVLVRQTMLGVSGRYKTPMIEMKFFDREYRYDLPGGEPQWSRVEELVAKTPSLQSLYTQLRTYLQQLIAQSSARELKFNVEAVSRSLQLAYVEAFSTPAFVGSYSREFWLAVTELDRGAAGALYRVLQKSLNNPRAEKLSPPELFAKASEDPSLDAAEKDRIAHICLLEPLLTELDLMFTLMLTDKRQPLEQAAEAWSQLGRNKQTLPRLAAEIENQPSMFSVLSDTGRKRLRQLLDVSKEPSIECQMRALHDYHCRVMERRGQLPWLRLGDNTLHLDVAARRQPTREQRGWANNYYVPQFKNLLLGLWGVTA